MVDGSRVIVCDTGPLISLEKLTGGYAFIRKLYDRLLIPPTVLRELVQGQFENADAYLDHFNVADLFHVEHPTADAPPETASLDEGERQAIALALERRLPLLIEEEAGRTVARHLGLRISGIAGQLLKAVRVNVLPTAEASAKLDQLHRAGRINQRVFSAVHSAIQDVPS